MMAQVVLRTDVSRVGKAGEVVKVAPGYARNFLIPRGLAWPAAPGTIKQAAMESTKSAVRRAHQFEEAKGVADRIQKADCRVKKSAGDQGRLFGAVTSGDVAKALTALGFPVERRMVVLPETIKALGVYTVIIRLAPEVEAKVKVLVEKG